MENKNTSISKPTAKSIAEQARNWAGSDKNHSAIVLLRNSQTGYTHSAIVCRDSVRLAETLVTHMLHDETFRDAVSTANYIVENHRDQIEDFIRQHQSHS